MEEEMKSKLEQYYKISKKIPYSTKVYGENEEEIKPKIILKNLKGEDENKKTISKTVLILKYKTLEGVPIEAIIGNVNGINDRKNKIEKIIELIENQLRDNAKKEEGYKDYTELVDYKTTVKFPIEFTLEGLEILSSKDSREIPIERTYRINENERVEKLFSDKELEEKKKWKIPEVVKYQLWQEGRDAILKGFRGEKSREAFLKGEKIAQIMKGIEIAEGDTEKELETKEKNKRKFVTDYLLDVYDGKIKSKHDAEQPIENENIKEIRERVEYSINSKDIDKRMRTQLEQIKAQLDLLGKKNIVDEQNSKDEKKDDEIELLNEYLKIKEKGLAIDINILLEDFEDKMTREIQRQLDEQEEKQDVEISPKDYKQIKVLQNYQHFFNFVKKGMDRTSRFYAIKEENLNFELLEKLFEKRNMQEAIQYIRLKCKMLDETKTDDISKNRQEYPSVRELYEFLLNSSVRTMTKRDDEEMFSKIFEKAKNYLLENNSKEINLYNFYAKKFKVYECPTCETGKDDVGNFTSEADLEDSINTSR